MNWKTKLSSRKLWACIIGVVVGVAVAFGVDGDTITTVAGAVTSLVSIITYVVTEGKIDAASVSTAYLNIDEIADLVIDALTGETAEVCEDKEIENIKVGGTCE